MDGGDVEFSGVASNGNGTTSVPDENASKVENKTDYYEKVPEEEIHFRAENIQRQNNDEMFVKVEGGEKYKREMERREKAEQEKARREAEKLEKDLAKKKVKTGKKHGKIWVIVGGLAIILICGGLALLQWGYFGKKSGDYYNQYLVDRKAYAKSRDAVYKMYSYLHGDDYYGDGMEWERVNTDYKKYLEDATREEKVFFYIQYALFIRDEYERGLEDPDEEEDAPSMLDIDNIKDAVSSLDEAFAIIETDYEKMVYYDAASGIYSRYDREKFSEYGENYNYYNKIVCEKIKEECV